MVYVSKGLPAGKTYPAPKTPVVMDQKGCMYVPARDGDPGRPALQDPQLRRHPAQRPHASEGQQGVQPGDAGDAQGSDHAVRQGRGDLPHQVRRSPLDERLRRRLQPSFLLRDEHRRQVHDLGPRPGHLRDHRLARDAGDADGLDHRRRQRQEGPGLQVRPSPPNSDPENSPHESPSSCRGPEAARRARSPSRGVRVLAQVRLLRRPQGHRHPVRHHRRSCSSSSASR